MGFWLVSAKSPQAFQSIFTFVLDTNFEGREYET